jgi:signal transduction histidine kinase
MMRSEPQVPRPRIRPLSSLGVRLPAVAGGLVLLVGALLVSAAYLTLRRTTVEDASARLATLSEQLSETFRASMAQLRAQVRSTADRAALADYLRSRDPALRPGALQALEYHGPQTDQVAAVELRDESGQVILATGTGADRLAAAIAPGAYPRPTLPDSAVVGKFILVGDSIVYPVVARVAARPAGYVVHWRRIGSAPRALEQTGRIIGSEAELHFGNADGSLWTNLSTVAPAPSIETSKLGGILTYTRPGERGTVLASAAGIAGTPWLFTIEFPRSTVLAPADAFLRKMAGIAFVCVTLGLLAAWLMSRQIVQPLRQLTDASDAIAAGDSSRRVQLTRADELGRLGESFDVMAGQVQESRLRLEEKVAARTKELNQTLERLQDAQESLVRREKLALLGHLASGVGHELRNPLGVMSNAVFYLEMVLEKSPENVREYLGILRQQIALSGKIVNDLLDFSRINPAQRQATALKSLAAAQLDRLAPLEGITVDQEFPDNLPAVHVDPVHAGQVVMNLLTNAVQAMGARGGRLTLRGRRNGGSTVMLEVSDTGPGIAPENLTRIFEPLFTTKARGIGLGLAVSKSLALANGGDVSVSSEPGAGATFVFTMPVAPDPT